MSDGRFYLGGLPDDDYGVWVHARYPWAAQWYDGRTNWDQADTVTVSGAGETSIAVVLAAGGKISGAVYAEDGTTPLENINLDVEPGGYGTCTDGAGRYTIDGLPYGEYLVVASTGWNWCTGKSVVHARQYYSGTSDPDLAIPFVLSPGQDAYADIDFSLAEGGVISGTVYASDGTTPLENINVDVGDGGYGACTDANGRYAIAGLPDGGYVVYAGGGHNWYNGGSGSERQGTLRLVGGWVL
jgi:hypothetical protein